MKWILRNIEELISGAALAVTVSIIVFNVIMRYIFIRSFNWAEETAAIGFAYVVFVGAAACYKRKMHIGIDVVVGVLPDAIQRIVEIGIAAFMVLLNGYLVYLSTVYAWHGWSRPTTAMRIPYFYVNISATIGFGFMLFHSCRFLIEDVKLWRTTGAAPRG